MLTLGERDPSLEIPVAFLLVRGLTRERPAQGVERALADFVAEVLATSTYEALAATPELAGYRDLHARLGKTGRQYLAAPESLFKLMFKRGAWRAVDPLIDAYTLISLQTRVSIGAHDAARLRLPLRLQPTVGGERVLLIGEASPIALSAHEYDGLPAGRGHQGHRRHPRGDLYPAGSRRPWRTATARDRGQTGAGAGGLGRYWCRTGAIRGLTLSPSKILRCT